MTISDGRGGGWGNRKKLIDQNLLDIRCWNCNDIDEVPKLKKQESDSGEPGP